MLYTLTSVSVAAILFSIDSHSVKVKIDIENHTDQQLKFVDQYQSSGDWGEFPQHVFPGKTESSFGRKDSHEATGKVQLSALVKIGYVLCSTH